MKTEDGRRKKDNLPGAEKTVNSEQ